MWSLLRRITTRRSARTGAVGCLGIGLVLCLAVAQVGASREEARPQRQVVGAQREVPPSASNDSAEKNDYVIGATDVLSVVFWGEKDLSTEVTVRPDGKISLPLLNDVVAAGLTPEQLRRALTDRASRFLEAPVVTVVVRQVNNNLAFVTGQVMRPGPYVLSGSTTVLHLLAMAGGFTEFADKKHILITRIENGVQRAHTFNYDDVVKRQDLSHNLVLKAGDTVVVP